MLISMSLKEKINLEKLPQHIAIIMDGNGRWAKEKNKNRLFGHRAGVKSLKNILRTPGELGIKFFTVYAFSTENWNRPKDEVSALMTILLQAIQSEIEEINKSNVKINVIGDISAFPKNIQKKIFDAVELTKNNDRICFSIALNYSGRYDILNATKKIAEDVKNNSLNADDIDETVFKKYLSTKNIPDPDLLIRTSGEYRISNFLLFEIAYSELYFTNTYWPDFSQEDFFSAIISYQSRERRFGKTSEQIKEITSK